MLLVLLVGWWYLGSIDTKVVSSFEECVAAGNPTMESYPPRCITKDGRSFTQDIGNELELIELIQVSYPRSNQLVNNPLNISGEARGTWMFEASFSGWIEDEAGNNLGTVILEASEDWMTEEFVPFSGVLSFSPPSGTKGKLILEKANPSGLPEHDQTLVIPVRFN